MKTNTNKIMKGTTVYHYSKGKGYILDIKERRGTGTDLITCAFPNKGCEFITRSALLSGEAEISLNPHKPKLNKDDDPLSSILEGVLRGF